MNANVIGRRSVKLRDLTAADKDALVGQYNRLLWKWSRRLARTPYGQRFGEPEDIYNEAVIYLFDAAERYDPGTGYALITYLYARAWRMLQRRAKEHGGGLVRVPLYLLDDRLEADGGEGDSGSRCREAARRALGLRQIPQTEDGEEIDLAGPDQERPDAERLAALRAGLASLSPRERMILEYRHGLNHRPVCTLQRTATMLGLSGEAVRRIEETALVNLFKVARRLVRSGEVS